MAATMKPSWNPLRLAGTPLPVPLLLSAKLIVVTMLATGHVWTLPDPFLPFVSVFDRIGDPVRVPNRAADPVPRRLRQFALQPQGATGFLRGR